MSRAAKERHAAMVPLADPATAAVRVKGTRRGHMLLEVVNYGKHQNLDNRLREKTYLLKRQLSRNPLNMHPCVQRRTP